MATAIVRTPNQRFALALGRAQQSALQEAARPAILPPQKMVRTLSEYAVAGANFNPIELTLEPGITESEWMQIGRAISHVGTSTYWWMGDWIRAGAKAYGVGVVYDLAVQATGMNRDRLYFCSYLAKKFEPARRVAALSWSHHMAVAHLAPELADSLLAEAVELGLTTCQLHEQGRAAQQQKKRFKARRTNVFLWPEELDKCEELAHEQHIHVRAFLAHVIQEWLREHGHMGAPPTKKELRGRWLAAGMCGQCGRRKRVCGENGKPTTSCRKCLDRGRKYDRFRRHERQELPQ